MKFDFEVLVPKDLLLVPEDGVREVWMEGLDNDAVVPLEWLNIFFSSNSGQRENAGSAHPAEESKPRLSW